MSTAPEPEAGRLIRCRCGRPVRTYWPIGPVERVERIRWHTVARGTRCPLSLAPLVGQGEFQVLREAPTAEEIGRAAGERLRARVKLPPEPEQMSPGDVLRWVAAARGDYVHGAPEEQTEQAQEIRRECDMLRKAALLVEGDRQLMQAMVPVARWGEAPANFQGGE